jgi:uncharacterized protein YndB with AHSA1/START domain
MSERSARHATFRIERTFDAPPARVFQAFADPDAKARWFAGPPEWERGPREFDFRVGGRETSSGGPTEGPKHRFEARYYDIVPNERIVYAYEMSLDGTRISVSLATIELKAAGRGTHLTLTEQGVFLDAHDDAGSREQGTGWLLDQLAASLREQAAA